MRNIFNTIFLILIFSCHNDLDQYPLDPDSVTEENVFSSASDAKGALAKLYSSLALTGQDGPAGQPDIANIDEGFSQYTRMLFNLNELTTDHAVCGWGDPGLADLHGMYWTSNNDFTEAMYNRLAQVISFCNSFISKCENIDGPQIKTFISEARFIRSFAYFNLIDLYGSVPLTTEVSTNLPSQATRQDLINFIETELLQIAGLDEFFNIDDQQSNVLLDSGLNEYGRVDKTASLGLLSKLYLNYQVWTGIEAFDKCVVVSEKIINNSSYTINTNDANNNGTSYDELFLADNDTNGAQNEFIFTANFDGINSQTYGGSTFLVHASIGGNMPPDEFGVNGGWYGLRTTKNLVQKFPTNDINSLNISLNGELSDWGLVGGATENGWIGPDMEMYEINEDFYQLYAYLEGNEAFKFRFNENWGFNYGANPNSNLIILGGQNIEISCSGLYLITLNLSESSYGLEKVNLSLDKRGMFYDCGQSVEIQDISSFDNGYAVTKFKNIDSNGNQGSDSTGNFVDIDLPLIRLAEIYLNYAEAILRGGGGDLNLATQKINELITRAYGNSLHNIGPNEMSLEFILDERSRELYWEGQRRTDLIRYNYFTSGNYIWPFKANVPQGGASDAFRNLFPIPSSSISANPNLIQNEGY